MFLKASEVLDNAEKAFKEGRLQMQSEEYRKGKTGCQYAGPCAIGVSLTPEEQKKLDDPYRVGFEGTSQDIATLIDQGYVTSDNDNALVELQRLHDEGVLRPGDFEWIRNECGVV